MVSLSVRRRFRERVVTPSASVEASTSLLLLFSITPLAGVTSFFDRFSVPTEAHGGALVFAKVAKDMVLDDGDALVATV